jgi:2-polyprenyl-3-methyl-5-hydroxy-6-metoxy-1,4-benzoquinol methylase
MRVPNRDVSRSCPAVFDLVRALHQGTTVVDVGCHGWMLSDASLASGVQYLGVDLVEPPGRPAHARFVRASDTRIDLPDDHCELAVASHVLEHVQTPTGLRAAYETVWGSPMIEVGGELSAEEPLAGRKDNR